MGLVKRWFLGVAVGLLLVAPAQADTSKLTRDRAEQALRAYGRWDEMRVIPLRCHRLGRLKLSCQAAMRYVAIYEDEEGREVFIARDRDVFHVRLHSAALQVYDFSRPHWHTVDLTVPNPHRDRAFQLGG